MTKLLEKAFAEASKLPAEEQDAIAAALLEDLAGERAWSSAFSDETSRNLPGELAAEALKEHRSGRTLELDPDAL